jgi:SpoVK/Ycf46/Vps4 family AAA+-type ATPase
MQQLSQLSFARSIPFVLQEFEELGRRTDGFSGSDINVIVKDVLMEPIRKTQEATHFRRAPASGAACHVSCCTTSNSQPGNQKCQSHRVLGTDQSPVKV